MTIFTHELKQSRMPLFIWTGAVGFLLIICVVIFPEMKGEMDDVSNMFASMGVFTEAFGMDKLNFGEFMGFYGIECGNILGLGGAFFASLIGISSLAKEEKEHTAEFLLTHPVSRAQVVGEKLAAIFTQLFLLNAVILLLTLLSVSLIGEKPEWSQLLLIHLSYFILQIETAGICFGVSAFLRRGTLGIGLGIAALFYFLNIIANITESAEFLKYITPFGYTDSADIITSSHLNIFLVFLGLAYTIVAISAAFIKYRTKDIA